MSAVLATGTAGPARPRLAVGPGPGSDVVVLALGATLLTIALGVLVVAILLNRRRLPPTAPGRLPSVGPCAAALRDGADLDRIIAATVEAIRDWGGATEVSVTLIDAEDALRRNEHVAAVNRIDAARRPWVRPPRRHPPPAVLATPLRTQESTIGLLRIRLVPGLDPADVSGDLQEFADQLAAAVLHARRVADLDRRIRERQALHDVLLQISHGQAASSSMASLVRHARDLLDGDDAALCLTESGSRPLHLGGSFAAAVRAETGPLCITCDNVLVLDGGSRQAACPLQTDPEGSLLQVPLQNRDGRIGTLCIARGYPSPFSGRDRGAATALAEVAAVAIHDVAARELDRQNAILAERERIAREMHDSLAQVLGLTHLRLRALGLRPDVRAIEEVESELAGLATVCQEAFDDVREAILGLRDARRPDRDLLSSLRAYLAEYTRRCGIRAELDPGAAPDLHLLPRCEVQVIRVIQEALTNVRKHAGARSAAVRIQHTAGAVRIVIEDDGRGFDPVDVADARNAFGLHSMRERIELVGGSLAVDSTRGAGTRITATIPATMVASGPAAGRSCPG